MTLSDQVARTSSAGEPGRAPKPRKIGRIVLIQLVVWPLALALGEGVHRLLLAARGTPYDSWEARASLTSTLRNIDRFVPELVEEESAAKVDQRAQKSLHPFTGYEIGGGRMMLDRELEELRAGKHDGAFEILILGGSVSQLFGKHGVERMTARLREDPLFADREIRYLRFGRGSYKQPQQLNMLSYLIALGFTPEAVVNLDGFNEVALSAQNLFANDAHPIFPSSGQWGHLTQSSSDPAALDTLMELRAHRAELRAVCERALASSAWTRLSLLGGWSLGNVERLRAAIVDAQGRYESLVVTSNEVARGPVWIPRDPKHPIVDCIEVWTEGSRMIDAICRDRGMAYLHVLQPTLWDSNSKPITDQERTLGTISKIMLRAVLEGYPRLREAGEALRAEGRPFVDGSRVFAEVEETLYRDFCHFDQQGNALLGEFIAEALIEHWPDDAAAARGRAASSLDDR